MRLLGLLVVAGLSGWGPQAPAAAPAYTIRAVKSALAQPDKAPGKPARNRSTIARPGQNEQTTVKPAKPSPANAAPHKQATAEDICRTVAQAAGENQIPVNFFARVIWQESRFNARAVSRKGAEGIAQFMPRTADFRGLADPFEPISSIENAARYLGDLRKGLGNLGLAAAAYNAGPGRVRLWLDRKGALPKETRDYVTITTGWSADEWASPSPPTLAEATIPQGFPCGNIARLVVPPLELARGIAACVPSWGARLPGSWSTARAWATYRAPQKQWATLIGDREPITLRKRFGSLALAAACYSADGGQVTEWLDRRGTPIATGWTANEQAWPPALKVSEISSASTAHLAAYVPRWGAQLTANWSEPGAWATYRALQKQFAALIGDHEPIMLHGSFPGMGPAPRYMIRIADDSRVYLERLCERLIAAGGACAVLRNEASLPMSAPAESRSE